MSGFVDLKNVNGDSIIVKSNLPWQILPDDIEYLHTGANKIKSTKYDCACIYIQTKGKPVRTNIWTCSDDHQKGFVRPQTSTQPNWFD